MSHLLLLLLAALVHTCQVPIWFIPVIHTCHVHTCLEVSSSCEHVCGETVTHFHACQVTYLVHACQHTVRGKHELRVQ